MGAVDYATFAYNIWTLPVPSFQPLPLVRRPHAFSHPDWVYEIKYDGFRALAYVDGSGARLISRNGNRFASFDPLCQSIAFFLRAKSAVLDGEIVCLDSKGHSQFNELLFLRGTPLFCVFDVLALNGRDLRHLSLGGKQAVLAQQSIGPT